MTNIDTAFSFFTLNNYTSKEISYIAGDIENPKKRDIDRLLEKMENNRDYRNADILVERWYSFMVS